MNGGNILARISSQITSSWRDLLLNNIASSSLVPSGLRRSIYRFYGMLIGTSHICPRCFIGGKQFRLGDRSFLNYGCFLDNGAPIVIGNDVLVGIEVLFCTTSHREGSSLRRGGQGFSKAIIIKDGCWIGSRVIILPGITIGEGCIIGAGSVVTKDCEANGLYCGNPARLIRELPRS